MAALGGIIAAVLTPLDQRLQPDTAKACAYYAQLLERGCDGLNILGTTGEAMSLSAEQRLAFMHGLADGGLDLERAMVGTGSSSLADTTALTRAALELGFGGALVMPPFFYRGVSDDGVLRFFEQLANTTSVSPGKLYLYNFPAMSGITFSSDLVHRINEVVPLAGLKDSSNDLEYCAELHRRFPALRIFPSSETHLRFTKNAGLAGCISGTVALWPESAHDIWRDAQSAHSEPPQSEIAAKREAVAAYPLIPAVRFLTALQEHDASWEIPLPPLQPLAQSERKTLALSSLFA